MFWNMLLPKDPNCTVFSTRRMIHVVEVSYLSGIADRRPHLDR